jgi:hypothetical protein
MVSLTGKVVDYSTKDNFSFGFLCDRCGKEWLSFPQPFELGDFKEVANEDARSLVWNEARRNAFERANVEAVFHFNNCPCCGRWVCDECFHTSEDEHTDICLDCAPLKTGESNKIQFGNGKGGTDNGK